MRQLGAPLAAALFVCAAAVGFSHARGDDIASKKIWTLGFEHGEPRRAVIGREPNLENYWYLPFTLRNEDQDDHGFFVEVTATDDKKNEYRSLAQPLVKEIARRRLGIARDEPFFSHEDLTVAHDPTDVNAPFPRKLDLPVIKAGTSARCVAIFKGPSPEADRLTIYVRGLTNDVIVEKTAPHERKLTEQVLEIAYERPGDEFYRTEDPFEFAGRRWVRVERVIKTDLE